MRKSIRKRAGVKFLAGHPDLRGVHLNAVNCLPLCPALQQEAGARDIHMIKTDLFPEIPPHFECGAIGASIRQDPYPGCYLNPGIVLRSNLHLFRELRAAGG